MRNGSETSSQERHTLASNASARCCGVIWATSAAVITLRSCMKRNISHDQQVGRVLGEALDRVEA